MLGYQGQHGDAEQNQGERRGREGGYIQIMSLCRAPKN
jgi:hypothetical protein